jgi:hypothetical protein
MSNEMHSIADHAIFLAQAMETKKIARIGFTGRVLVDSGTEAIETPTDLGMARYMAPETTRLGGLMQKYALGIGAAFHLLSSEKLAVATTVFSLNERLRRGDQSVLIYDTLGKVSQKEQF